MNTEHSKLDIKIIYPSLEELIKEDRPAISQSSINTYLSNLKSLGITTQPQTEKLHDVEGIIESISKHKVSQQRNLISAIMIILRANNMRKHTYELYRQKLYDLGLIYSKEINENKKTEVQEKNWIKIDELKKITKKMLKKNVNQKSLIAALYSFQPPVRLDYYNMKIVGKDEETNDKQNYLVVYNTRRKEFIFNDFKTAHKYNQVVVKINPAINRILNKFLKQNPNREYLLQQKNGNPLTRNGLGRMLPRIFKETGKEVSINIIRHCYISENTDLEMLKSAKDLAKNMMHSSGVQMSYAKNETVEDENNQS